MALKLITGPAAIWTTAEFRALMKREAADDAQVALALAFAMGKLDGPKGIIDRALMPQTWEEQIDAFPADPAALGIELALPPLQSVTSIKYLDTDLVEQTLSAALYAVDTTREPGMVVPGEAGWPTTGVAINAVKIRFVAGYADAAAVPGEIKGAIVAVGAHWLESLGVTEDVRDLPEVQSVRNRYRDWVFG